ncbi:MAG: energy-coupling factor ABC transporter permease [Proteobacteria bacterium]|nr:energy-coupling factor ABC transporter permease [Pseudomonadota bacterium]MBU1737214.1 energy-coupling factor ABC transporter permease [Pseudomonadota bacterium]
MHMADALLSPTVGGIMWAATAITTVYCSKKVSANPDDRKIPLMGVLGAFVFTAQMINFAIPGTGSSGHLGGGILLAALLGPHASFLVMASVLIVQALFFADGGLLALGCNIFNLGFFPCLVAYPLIYKPIAGRTPTPAGVLSASLGASVIGLQLGSLGVVSQTWLSGVTELSYTSFIMFMQPIHLIIGMAEGVITAGVISFIWKARPEILSRAAGDLPVGDLPIKNVLIGFGLAALVTGGFLVLYVSENPDGLNWAVEQAGRTGTPERPATALQRNLAELQNKTAIQPEYQAKTDHSHRDRNTKSLAGLAGGIIVLLMVLVTGSIVRKIRLKNTSREQHLR